VRHWQIALGRIRLRGPDESHFNKDVKYVYNHVARLEAALRRIAEGAESNPAQEVVKVARDALQEKGD